MMIRPFGMALACLLFATATAGSAGSAHPAPAQGGSLDATLAAYLGGDTAIIARTFTRPRDFEVLRRDLDRWLKSWDRGKALVLLEVSRVAGSVAPQYAATIVNVGRVYMETASGGDRAAPDFAAFVQTWHDAAAGVLQRASDPWKVEAYVTDVLGTSTSASSGRLTGRLLLARAVAQERRCWDQRPALEQASPEVEVLAKAADMVVPDDLDGLAKAGRAAKVRSHLTCLGEALTRLEAAARDDTRVEASVRAGWILFQMGRSQDALNRLEIVPPGDDRDLAFWLALFRGRALDALGRVADSVAAYRSALALVPTAQSAGIGLALELVRLDRRAEADQRARALRSAGAAGPDPWSFYMNGDDRLVDDWLKQLRAALR